MSTPPKRDERCLLSLIRAGFDPHQATKILQMPIKRAAYILSKWTSKGTWHYGVNVMCGWLEPRGDSPAHDHINPTWKRSAPGVTPTRTPR